MNILRAVIPAHVPDELVYDYDYFDTPSQYTQPHWEVAKQLKREAPPIFYTARNGGHWVVTRTTDMREMFRHPEIFSSDPQFNYNKRAMPSRFLPNLYDPPELSDARRIISPRLIPAAVAKLELHIRQLAGELIDAVYRDGKCDFVDAIAKRFSVTIFLKMADAPLHHREAMLEMAHRYLHAKDPKTAQAGLRDLGHFLTSLIEERRANPKDDLVSQIVTSTFLDKPLTEEQTLGATVFIFVAGLDTVVSTLSFIMRFLAVNPDLYDVLVRDRSRIPAAVEELVRVSGVTMPERGVCQDAVYNGIEFKKYDRVLYLLQISGMDEDETDNPFLVDFNRPVSRHIQFGAGPHRCLGSHLARLELKVFLEEWTSRMPTFGLQEGTRIRVTGGTLWELRELPLAWPLAPQPASPAPNSRDTI